MNRVYLKCSFGQCLIFLNRHCNSIWYISNIFIKHLSFYWSIEIHIAGMKKKEWKSPSKIIYELVKSAEPKLKNFIYRKFTSIDFPALKLNLMLPPSIKLKTSAVRGMWLNYDHFSDYCPTFDLPVKIIKNLGLIELNLKRYITT